MPHKFDPSRRARLEDPERLRLLPPEQLLRRAGLTAGMRMADVGCGPGFFTLPAAAIVGPTGQVFALDISEEMLEAVRAKADAAGLTNVIITRSAEHALPLPDRAVDFALLGFVLHEIVDPQAFVREVARILGPGGRFLLLEWEARAMPMGPPPSDRLPPATVERWLADAGFSLMERFSPNPYHYGVVARLSRPAIPGPEP